MGDRYSMFFVQYEQNLRPLVAQIIDQAVVKTAITRSGHQGDEFDPELTQHLGNCITAPGHCDVFAWLRALDRFQCRPLLDVVASHASHDGDSLMIPNVN